MPAVRSERLLFRKTQYKSVNYIPLGPRLEVENCSDIIQHVRRWGYIKDLGTLGSISDVTEVDLRPNHLYTVQRWKDRNSKRQVLHERDERRRQSRAERAQLEWEAEQRERRLERERQATIEWEQAANACRIKP